MQRIVLGNITATPLDMLHGDLYPPGIPDGILNLSDLLIQLQIIQQTSIPVAVDDSSAATTEEDIPVTTGNVLTNDTLVVGQEASFGKCKRMPDSYKSGHWDVDNNSSYVALKVYQA